MKLVHFRRLLFFTIILLLSGCKENLYNNLSEEEANQMLAILILNKIESDKEVTKNGNVTVSVEKKQFVNAVELLRQNGFPRKKNFDINQIFPSGQLVSSPEQEKVKINYLKEQQLEKMILNMDGVIESSISIALDKTDNTGRQKIAPSAAVLIKYSPEVNIYVYQDQIKNLIHDSIPGVKYNDISIMMVPAMLRYSPHDSSRNNSKSYPVNMETITLCAGIVVAVLALGIIFLLLFRRNKH